jgi:hypothetical protein
MLEIFKEIKDEDITAWEEDSNCRLEEIALKTL